MKSRLALPFAFALATTIGACATGETDETGTGGRGGDSGSAGTSGAAGTTGAAGHGGTTGAAGTGTTGRGGTTGTAGNSGTGGSTGTPGDAGTTGTAGTTGRGGTTGTAGSAGTTRNRWARRHHRYSRQRRNDRNRRARRHHRRGRQRRNDRNRGARRHHRHGGTTGTAGTGGQSSNAICNFASGLNIAWVNFANDVPNPDTGDVQHDLQEHARRRRARDPLVVPHQRHQDAGLRRRGLAVKLPQSHIDGVKAILSAANSNGVSVNISLWSFDMLQMNAGNTYVQNQALLENDANRQAYIDNYLTPLVNAIKGTPGLYSWEIFNEPEGMGPKGWATHKTTQAAIQKTVNWLAAAIHTADPAARVTNGSQTFDYCSAVSGKSNWYSDSALRAAGGKQNGTLDFYEVHYYDGTNRWTRYALSPFGHPATYWGLDKKLVIGEFYAVTTDGVQTNDLYTNLYTNGYNGAWAWQYNDAGMTPQNTPIKWPSMQAPIQNVYNAHQADVGACK